MSTICFCFYQGIYQTCSIHFFSTLTIIFFKQFEFRFAENCKIKCFIYVELDLLRYLAKFSSPYCSWPALLLGPQFFRRLAKKLCEIFKLTAELVPQVASTHSTHLAQWPFWDLTKPTVDWATWDAAPREGKGTKPSLSVCVCVKWNGMCLAYLARQSGKVQPCAKPELSSSINC